MASNEGIDPITLGTKVEGFAPPILTYGQLNMQPLMTAMQQRARNAQNARENEIALQQLASKEQLAQAEMQLKRDQFAAEAPLRQAQIENYQALAGYHNRMGKAQSDAITKQWQYNASLVPELAKYHDAMRDLNQQSEIGSEDWWTKRNALEQDFNEILSTDPGSKAQNAWDARGTRASAAIAQGQQRTAQSLNDAVSKYGIPMSAVSQLQGAVDADEAKLAGYTPSQRIAYQRGYGGQAPPTSSDVWGLNPDGSRFAYFPVSPTGAVDPHAQPASLSAVKALDADEKAKLRPITIEKPQVDSIVAASRALSGPLRGNGVAPQWAYSLRGGRAQPAEPQQRVRRYDPASGKYVDVTGP